MKRLGIVLTALGLLGATACGGLPANEGAPSTLVTLHGQVQSAAGGVSAADVHVALIWGNAADHLLAVDAPVQPTFPAGFSLPIQNAPPASFVVPNKDLGNAEAVWGAVVAYQDLNKDGKLDLLNKSSTHYIDRIVGADKTQLIVFLNSAPPAGATQLKDSNGALPHAGFNIMHMSGSGSSFTWVPLTTELTLTEDDSTATQKLMCASETSVSAAGTGTVNAPPGTIGPNNQYPASNDPALTCNFAGNVDEYGYTADKVTVDRPCYTETTSTTTIYSKAPGTSPAGWPCP